MRYLPHEGEIAYRDLCEILDEWNKLGPDSPTRYATELLYKGVSYDLETLVENDWIQEAVFVVYLKDVK